MTHEVFNYRIHPISLYGEYLHSPETSVCLGKDLPVDEA